MEGLPAIMIFEQRKLNENAFDELVKAGTHPVLARLFASRGITGPHDTLLELKNLIPPTQLKNCASAAKYLADAFEKNTPILIVADYDCDGATACAVGIRGLTELGQSFNTKIDFLVPNRFTMGYGLTPEVVDLAASRLPKPGILLTVDNGIASIAGVDHANSLGINVLVTDHHLPGDTLPLATSIVNPSQPGCTFPSKALAGVGVMFYLLLALRAELRERGVFTNESQPKLESLLDLVALGTVADVASLDRNNRILVSAGLRRIRQGLAQPGIKALFNVANRDIPKANAFDLGFAVGPRLNAAGRLADMTLGIRCLITDDETEANRLAYELDRINRERRVIESDMQESALENLVDVDVQKIYGLCLTDPSWHQGVIGILASRLKERYHRPVLIFAEGEDGNSNEPVLKGSGRSITGFHLRDALDWISKKHPDLILKFGGHAMAAGLTIPASGFELFNQTFNEIAQLWLDEASLNRRLVHDGALNPSEIEADLAQILSDQVWGQGFPQPVFMGTFEIAKQTLLKDKHLKLELFPANNTPNTGKPLPAIWFGRSESLPNVVNLAYRLGVDNFLGYPRTQLYIEAAEL
jgi:single-stranded-DNA-specific exonuclease